MDGVAHIGGLPEDDEWERIYQSNIAGTYNVFEACRRVGVLSRYPRGPTLTVDIVPTPVGFYTISKVFGESIAYSYAREYDMGCVCVRIGSLNLPETSLLNLSPSKPQRLPVGLQSWPSDSFVVVFGVSGSNWPLYDLEHSRQAIGYYPQDRWN